MQLFCPLLLTPEILKRKLLSAAAARLGLREEDNLEGSGQSFQHSELATIKFSQSRILVPRN